MGRTATGVRGLRLDDDGEDEVVGMVCLACNKPLDPSMFNENEEEADDDVADVAEEEEDSSVDVQEQAEDVSDDFPETIMVVSEKGYGKRSNIGGYRITHRGGKGVKTLNITEKTGKLVAIKSVTDDNDLMIINKSGIAIRLAVSDVRVQGRATQGVSLINLKKRNDVISSVCKVEHVEPENEENSQETSENTESIPENQN